MLYYDSRVSAEDEGGQEKVVGPYGMVTYKRRWPCQPCSREFRALG